VIDGFTNEPRFRMWFLLLSLNAVQHEQSVVSLFECYVSLCDRCCVHRPAIFKNCMYTFLALLPVAKNCVS
jgi:hypothetical protein